eukprot:10248632-Ditylum_brightwellii.AAC.1
MRQLARHLMQRVAPRATDRLLLAADVAVVVVAAGCSSVLRTRPQGPAGGGDGLQGSEQRGQSKAAS